MRAISTVLDASLCLLLVSASALTLAGTPSATPLAGESGGTVGPATADEIAELLAASTSHVTYDAGNRTRTAHDTLAGLLASAAVADARPPSRPATRTDFVQAVTTGVTRAVRQRAVRRAAVRPSQVEVQVVARSNVSKANSTRRGRVVAGDAPPPDADVHAAAFEVREVGLTVRTWSK